MCFDALKYKLTVDNVSNGNTRVRLVGMGVDHGGRIDSAVGHQRKGPLIPDCELAAFDVNGVRL